MPPIPTTTAVAAKGEPSYTPPAALIPLTAEGKPDLLKVFFAVLRRPLQIGAMIGLARETAIALSALIGPARALRSLIATV